MTDDRTLTVWDAIKTKRAVRDFVCAYRPRVVVNDATKTPCSLKQRAS